jgi:branched-chain amino acid transport system permease protein
VHVLGLELGTYRLFLIAFVIVITLALGYLIERTRFGAQIRASVDNQEASAGLGIHVNRVFSLTFALGSGLAGLGGALGIPVLGLDPTFPLKYIVYFLLVVAVGGTRARRVRRCREVLRSPDRGVRDLRVDGRASHPVSGWPLLET